MMGHQPPSSAFTILHRDLIWRHEYDADHVLRKVARMVDFDFVYQKVKDRYGYNGNVSVAPPMILKLMMLLVLYNVRSERGVDGDITGAARLVVVSGIGVGFGDTATTAC